MAQTSTANTRERSRYAIVEGILGRHSMRDGFVDREIPRNVIEEIIRCGLRAPSSKNAQPWRLHVVRDRRVLKDIAQETVSAKTDKKFVPQDPRNGQSRTNLNETVDESAHVLRQVPLGIFIENLGKFTVNRSTVAKAPEASREGALIGVALEYIGLGACIENMWLAAEAHDVHGAFMGDVLITEDTIRQRLGFTGDLVGVLALGYTDAEPHSMAQKPDRVVWHS